MSAEDKKFKVKVTARGAADAAQASDSVVVETAEVAEVAKAAAGDLAEASAWWSVLGCVWLLAAFFIPHLPLIGMVTIVAAELALILFWRNKKPAHSRRLAKGMMVGAIAMLIFLVVFAIVIPLIMYGLQGVLIDEMNSSAAEVDAMMELLTQRSEG